VRFPCPCCGYKTLPARSPCDEICEVCFWQDDFVDNHDTDVLGPNRVRLSVARSNYERWGASEQRFVEHVRAPRPEEGPPEPWTETRTTLESAS
jgi:Cysteine-rich CPCC